MKIQIVQTISDIPAAQWDALVGRNPFQRHAFLHALESTGCVGGNTGWVPAHIVLRKDGDMVALAAAYIKSHSRGEYVYDFSWARAAQLNGIRYYPKLVITSPFTPVESERLHAKTPELKRELARVIPNVAQQLGCVGAHVLFAPSHETNLLEEFGAMTRLAFQFHWNNNSYKSFDDYLSDFRSRRRKEIRRERRAVEKEGIDVRTMVGEEIPKAYAADIYDFYDLTHAHYGWTGYLNEAFFSKILETMPEDIVYFGAYRNDVMLGGAFCLRDEKRLYGRYWGAREEISQLHFETALYTPIQWGIEEGIEVIEPGAGGEHKFRRGFMPRTTYSSHWHFNPSFHDALADFCRREAVAVEEHIDDMMTTSTPFRRDETK